VQQFNRDITDRLICQLQAKDLYYPFYYLNDAGGDQEIYRFYGGGKSLRRMKAIRQKYDPKGIFQKFLGSGFHLGI
jgi:hypothetical protein